MWYKRYGKRAFDFVLALVLVLLTLPFQLIILICLGILLGPKNIFFRQRRIGYKGQLFSIIKFTSLKPLPEGEDLLAVNPDREFPFGTLLRKSVLDELPQLYQVLSGHMSLIGPRPLLPEYMAYYNQDQQRRHLVKPGITGWAQVHGGNLSSWQERLALDVEYADRYSLQMDLEILKESFAYFFKAKRKNEPTVIAPWKGE